MKLHLRQLNVSKEQDRMKNIDLNLRRHQKLFKIDWDLKKKVIELLTANTPNGKKISIMLEEIGFKYKLTKIDINKNEQFKFEFKKISPFSKIPVIIDHEVKISLFESGAILIYLGQKSGKFYNKEKQTIINQWLMGQMSYIGPMLGQHHQFHHYHPGKSEFGEKRYFNICERIYKELDERLSKSKYLALDEYTIADIATFPWIARHEWHDIGLKKFKNLSRWYFDISKREAVKKGYDLLKKGELIPSV
jgi:GST-like protein